MLIPTCNKCWLLLAQAVRRRDSIIVELRINNGINSEEIQQPDYNHNGACSNAGDNNKKETTDMKEEITDSYFYGGN